MKYLLIGLLFAANAIAGDITCNNIKQNVTYQGWCVEGVNEANCQQYIITEGLGLFKQPLRPTSLKPYFIKTPDIDINKLVDCETFKAEKVRTYKIDEFLNEESIKPIKNNYTNLYKDYGTLYVDFFFDARENPKLAKQHLKEFAAMAKKITKATINIERNETFLRLTNINLKETQMLRQLFYSKILKFTWMNSSFSKVIKIK